MKKWGFWAVMCALSLLHFACFVQATLAMVLSQEAERLGGNYTASPMLWILGAAVLTVVQLCAVSYGRHELRHCSEIHPLRFFRFSGLGTGRILRRAGGLAAVFLAAALAFALFAWADLWALAYALSGGLLLLSLAIWLDAGSGDCF